MADIVLGLASARSPMVNFPPERWAALGENDKTRTGMRRGDGKADIARPRHTGTLVDLQVESSSRWQFEGHQVQGHLITHFWLDTFQIAVPEIRALDPITELIGRPDLAKAAGRRLKAGRAAARRRYWWNAIDSRAWHQISPWQEDNCPRLLPVRDGKEISETQAEREWSAWLLGKFE